MQGKTRRDVLKSLTAIAGAAGLEAAGQGYRPVLAVQTYVWTQKLDGENKTLAEGIEEVFAGSRSAGFRHIELVSSFVQSEVLEKTRAALKKNGMRAPIVYTGCQFHDPAAAAKSIADALAVADVAKSIGAGYLNVNPGVKPRRERKSDEELATQARNVDKLAQALQGRGMKLMLHHHDPEMADNAREWRHLLKNTDAKLTGLNIDVHWVLRGGQDVMTILRETGPRLVSLHLRNSTNGVWDEAFGAGDVEYVKVAEFLKEIKFRGYLVVELAVEKNTKVTRPLVDSLRLSREYAGKTFGVKA